MEEPRPEALAQQQAESEREVAALYETVTSQSTQLREIITLQHSQHGSVATLLNDTEALKGVMLTWQQRADTQEQQIAALQTRLREEEQAREALAQQVATSAAQKMTPRRKKQEA